MREALNKINAARVISDHLVGKHHTERRRMVVGVVIMSVGVGISGAGAEVGVHAVKFVAEAIGYLIHGIGCVPFIDRLIEMVDNKEEDAGFPEIDKE